LTSEIIAKSLSHRERDFNPTPLLPFWEKGLGDEGKEFNGATSMLVPMKSAVSTKELYC
jgi:hypothetical protein